MNKSYTVTAEEGVVSKDYLRNLLEESLAKYPDDVNLLSAGFQICSATEDGLQVSCQLAGNPMAGLSLAGGFVNGWDTASREVPDEDKLSVLMGALPALTAPMLTLLRAEREAEQAKNHRPVETTPEEPHD